jgi:hypothetical protein
MNKLATSAQMISNDIKWYQMILNNKTSAFSVIIFDFWFLLNSTENHHFHMNWLTNEYKSSIKLFDSFCNFGKN